MAEGESLRKICSSDDMPNKGTVMRWLAEDEDGRLRDQYARARDMQADAIFDECLDIADDGVNDWVADQEGGDQYNGDHVQRARLRIDTRKWMAGKLRPKKYGDKLDVDLNGTLKVEGVAVEFRKGADESQDADG
jgi:hypothetical protein